MLRLTLFTILLLCLLATSSSSVQSKNIIVDENNAYSLWCQNRLGEKDLESLNWYQSKLQSFEAGNKLIQLLKKSLKKDEKNKFKNGGWKVHQEDDFHMKEIDNLIFANEQIKDVREELEQKSTNGYQCVSEFELQACGRDLIHDIDTGDERIPLRSRENAEKRTGGVVADPNNNQDPNVKTFKTRDEHTSGFVSGHVNADGSRTTSTTVSHTVTETKVEVKQNNVNNKQDNSKERKVAGKGVESLVTKSHEEQQLEEIAKAHQKAHFEQHAANHYHRHMKHRAERENYHDELRKQRQGHFENARHAHDHERTSSRSVSATHKPLTDEELAARQVAESKAKSEAQNTHDHMHSHFQGHIHKLNAQRRGMRENNERAQRIHRQRIAAAHRGAKSDEDDFDADDLDRVGKFDADKAEKEFKEKYWRVKDMTNSEKKQFDDQLHQEHHVGGQFAEIRKPPLEEQGSDL